MERKNELFLFFYNGISNMWCNLFNFWKEKWFIKRRKRNENILSQ